MTPTKLLARASLGVAAAVALVAGGVSMTSIATAAPSASATIQARQANFKKMGGAMKVLKDQLASGSIDKAAATTAAKTLADTARGQRKLFPAGSGPSSGVKTDALAAIWTNKAGFGAQWSKFQPEADKLVAAASTGDAAKLGAQFKAVGAACGGCHKQFRADD
jgi:cytochrome c556